MINFDPKKADIFQAVKRRRFFGLLRILKKILIPVFIICFGVFWYGFLFETLTSNLLSFLLGFSILSFTFIVIFQITDYFFNLKFKKPSLKYSIEEAIEKPEEFNFASFLNYDAAKAVSYAIGLSKKRKLPKISSEALLYSCLKDKDIKINFIFSRAGLSQEEIKQELKKYLDGLKGEGYQEIFSDDFLKVIFEAAKEAKKKERNTIGLGDIITSQSQVDPIFKKHLVNAELKTQDIENLFWWVENLEKRLKESKKFWEYKNLAKLGSIAYDWAAGYTLTLDKFSCDLTRIIKKRGFEETVGHKDEIRQVERILDSPKINNVLLIGEPGTGRKSIVHQLAIKSFLETSLPSINHKRIVELDLASLITQTTSIEETERILDTIFKEVVFSGNVILVIDEFHNFVGQEIRPGVIDISGVLGQYLLLPTFQIIAITTFSGLHRFIEPNTSILNLFEKVEVSEISEQETIRVLENLVPWLEKKYKKFVTYPVLRNIVRLCSRYIPNVSFPKKAIDLLEETMVYTARYTKSPEVLSQHVNKVISEKTQIPIGKIEIQEREILINLESLIHKRIINQEEAVEEVSSALRRARADITMRSGPMGAFLFLGPTGVGKTETAKAITEIYFGEEKRMIRLDMSEFQNIKDIARLIGTPDEEGLLTTPVRENPFSLVLLDEIEKAHPNILNLFLQVIDEGHITDGMGRKISFLNTIIVATSNAGYKVILKGIKEKTDFSQIKPRLLDELFEKAIFRPEFINRFDAVVIFKPLTRQNLFDIAQLLLQKLKKNLSKKDIEFIITEPLKEKIVQLGYKPIFGARPMRRVIQDKIEDVLAEAILKGELKRGDKVEVESENFKLRIK